MNHEDITRATEFVVIASRKLVVGALTFFAAGAPAFAQGPMKSRSPLVNSPEQRVDSLFGSVIRRDGPGCAVGVWKNGTTVLSRGYGLASVEERRAITPRTTFDLGSASKPFTAVAALMLEQRGKLSLDDDVRRYVPELPNYGTPIRVRDLLQHTSGLRDYGALQMLSGRPVATMAEFLALIAAQRALHFTPGSQHEYSHSDYLLLGLVVERVAGVPFGDYLEREVLRPMGMAGSGVHDAREMALKQRGYGHVVSAAGSRIQFPRDWTIGGSNLYASVEDLARWDRNLEEPKVGGPEVIARMLGRPTLPSGDTIPYAYGLRLGTYRGLRTVSRGGHAAGTRTEIIRFPEQRFAVATLCNADHLEAGTIAQAVADIYLGPLMHPARARPVAPLPVAVSPHELTRYAGLYRPVNLPWNVVPIVVTDGKLGEVVFDGVRGDTVVIMTPAGAGRFFEIGTTGNVGIFSFRSAGADAPLRLEISWNGVDAESLERIADSVVWRPSQLALTEYAGSWLSDELDAIWQLESRREKLVLLRRGQPDLTLVPVERDQFMRVFGSWDHPLYAHLQFHRDGEGKLTHLILSTPPGEDSVRGLRFLPLKGRTGP